MMISIDQRLITAASLVWETFTDTDAQDHYWNLTLSGSARIRQGAISLGTVFHFLLSLQAWLHRFDYEDIEQYQTALPAAHSAKLLSAASVQLEKTNPWDEEVEAGQFDAATVDGLTVPGTAIPADRASTQLLLPSAPAPN